MDREAIIQKFESIKGTGEGLARELLTKPLLVLYAIGKLLRDESPISSHTAEVDENLRTITAGIWSQTSEEIKPQVSLLAISKMTIASGRYPMLDKIGQRLAKGDALAE